MKPRNEPRGIALVIVLACVALIAMLFIVYFATATHAVQTSTVYRSGIAAQQLADSAVNIVMGQIADGTHTAKQGAPTESLVWMSQPGLIRTYGTDGAPYRVYKLYSSDDMVVQNFPGGYWSPGENQTREVPDDWFEQRGLFADLNEPVLVPFDNGSGTNVPDGAIHVGGSLNYVSYPILDPSAQSKGNAAVNRDGVEGFSIDATRVSGAPRGAPPAGYNPTVITDPHHSPNPAPMPVRWLYVLRDGKITMPGSAVRTADGSLEMRWTAGSADAPTRQNPIVGRIAFWADDETCKLNINTASEGTFWDRPGAPTGGSANPIDETNMANRIPRKDEWQRLPGHPAMTCLSPVFGMLPAFQVPIGEVITTTDYAKYEAYYQMLPRIGGVDGTRAGLLQPPKPILNLDKDRLFGSVDELLFTPQRGYTPGVTRSFLEKAKFFLTTSNRAPETNMFNRPRVALWPLQQETDPNFGFPGCPARPRTPQDDLIAQCMTIGGKPPKPYLYYFQRYSVFLGGTINDRNQHPDIPFGQQGPPFGIDPKLGVQPPSSQRTDLDWTITRNQELYKYLQDLTSRDVPGVAGRRSLADKFGAGDRDQLLTEMVDLLRTANSETPSQFQGQAFAYAYSVPHDASGPLRSGAGQVVPLIPPAGTPGAGTKGFGRFPTVTELGLVVFRAESGIGAILWIEPFCPSAGPPATVPLVRFCIRGLDQFSINGHSFDMPPVATSMVSPGYMCQHCAHAHNCYYGMARYWAPWGDAVDKTVGTANEEQNYPFCSRSIVPLPKSGGLNFSGGEITIEIHSGYQGTIGTSLSAPSPETLVQTLHLTFPPALWPVPPDGSRSMSEAMLGENPIGGFEIVRSVQVDPSGPSRGDLRLVASLRDVPANYFHPHPKYFSATEPYAHTFRAGDDFIQGFSSSVTLLPGHPTQASLGANGLQGAFLSGTQWLGDWDSGAGRYGDGAQFPRLDAGNGDSTSGGYTIVSYAGRNYKPETGATWSPLREVPSPVIFGSLPVGARAQSPQPWRTPLFCANPASGKYHPGWGQPRDHYLLDFFQMPVVEPYAISEPLSSAGKVNLNCEIAPFTYIQRDTALRGAFRATKVTAISNKQGDIPVTPLRLDIDADETLKGFRSRFADKGGCFRTASELCEMQLVPKGATLADMRGGDPGSWWWKDYVSTGDNLRESPYGHLYSRVTARSNTFTVHYRVQVLAHNATAHPNVWIDGTDPVLAESRGSALIERNIDPSNPLLLDFATDHTATLDDAWKFRIVRMQRFGR